MANVWEMSVDDLDEHYRRYSGEPFLKCDGSSIREVNRDHASPYTQDYMSAVEIGDAASRDREDSVVK